MQHEACPAVRKWSEKGVMREEARLLSSARARQTQEREGLVGVGGEGAELGMLLCVGGVLLRRKRGRDGEGGT